MKRLLLTLALALTLLAPSAALAADSAPRLTPIGRMHFPERGYLVELPRHAVLHADDVVGAFGDERCDAAREGGKDVGFHVLFLRVEA